MATIFWAFLVHQALYKYVIQPLPPFPNVGTISILQMKKWYQETEDPTVG